ncbi:protein kinase [Streptomyces sp. NPDC001717]|uniref:protein kinase domain-containing protein n=1 Tax=Streptomyces sp. NPDC001717 TaxID=3364604 RepID=UPI0036AF8541
MGDVFTQGETLAGGRYRIDGSLGEGGMAQVYQAYDLKLARPVAIKTMLPGLAVEPGLPERFRREARAMAKLAHPNVVTVHDTGEEPRRDGPPVPYFVMELVTGPSLAHRLRTGGALPVPAALHVADQVLNALGASHDQALVHRDIKPANVLLAEGDITKVADFGIVRAIAGAGAGTTLTGTGMMVGTAYYMSPEQARGLPLDGRSDLYAVGVLLFEMLTGRPPFGGADVFAIAVRHVNDPPPTLASRGLPGLPALEAVLARALAKSPEDRYPNAAAMRTALRAAAEAAAAGPRAPGTSDPSPQPPQPAPTRHLPGPARPPVRVPPPPPARAGVRHGVRLGICAVLPVVCFGFYADAGADTLWKAYVGAGFAGIGALGALPTLIERSGSRLGNRYRVASGIVLAVNLLFGSTALSAAGQQGDIGRNDGEHGLSAPYRSASAMRITHTATATSSAASASSRITSTA